MQAQRRSLRAVTTLFHYPSSERLQDIVRLACCSSTLTAILWTPLSGKKISNGTPFRRAVEEGLLEPRRIVQVGIRGTLFRADDLEWAKSQGITIIDIDDFYDTGVRDVIARVREIVGSGPCYLSFDVDGLDPVYAPGTGSLEPGGLTVRDAQLLLRGMRGLDLVGADVTEVCPPLDPSGNTALVAANIMFEQLCLLAETRAQIR